MRKPSQVHATVAGLDHNKIKFGRFRNVARSIMLSGNPKMIKALYNALTTYLANAELKATTAPFVRLYHSMSKWALEGEFTLPAMNRNMARIQIWELEKDCPIFDYQKCYVKEVLKKWPNTRGFQMLDRVYNTIQTTHSEFMDSSGDDFQVFEREGADCTIIAFCGNKNELGISLKLFDRAVAEPANANLIVLRDYNKKLFLSGMKTIGDFEASIAQLSETLKRFSNTRIVALGTSGGVFGAILCGAAVGIKHIVALAGPTSLDIGVGDENRQTYQNIKADVEKGLIEYPNLSEIISNSSIETIDFFVSELDEFDMAHMRDLEQNTSLLVPHIFKGIKEHVVIDFAIENGSLHKVITGA